MKLDGPGTLLLLGEVGPMANREGVLGRFDGPVTSSTQAHFQGHEWNRPSKWGLVLSSGHTLNSLMICLNMSSFLPLSDNKRAAVMLARSSLHQDLFSSPMNM